MRILKGSGLSLVDAAEIAMNAQDFGIAENITLEASADRFLHAKLLEKKSENTFLFYESKLNRFTEELGSEIIARIDRKTLKGWIERQGSKGNQAATFRALRALFRWCAAQEPPLIGKDPTKGLSFKGEATAEPKFLAIEEVKAILEKMPPEMVSAVALQVFAGIRPEEIRGKGKPPLTWAHVRIQEKIIRIPADVSKTRRTRILENLPDNIWGWLTPGADRAPVSPIMHDQLTRRAQIAGGFKAGDRYRARIKPWPYDGMRHTFATYHVAAYQDPGRTSLILGHEGKTTLLYRSYRGLVTQAEGLRYFEILP